MNEHRFGRFSWTVSAVAWWILFLCLPPLFAQTGERVLGGDFNDSSSLANWPTTANFTTTSWSGTDWQSSVDSGSVLVTYIGGNGTSGGPAQCVLIGGDQVYAASARGHIESGQAPAGYFNLYVQFFSSSDCSVPTIGQTGLSFVPVNPGDFDVWRLVQFDAMTPGSAQSAQISLRAFKSAGEVGDEFSMYVDAVSFVTLDLLIFSDGFESGTTNEWTSTP